MLTLELEATQGSPNLDGFRLLLNCQGASNRFRMAVYFSPAFTTDHLPPYGVTFPGNMFALVEFQLSLGGGDITLGHTMSVKVEEVVQGRRDLVFGCLSKGRRMFHHFMQVSVFQLQGDGENKDRSRQGCCSPR